MGKKDDKDHKDDKDIDLNSADEIRHTCKDPHQIGVCLACLLESEQKKKENTMVLTDEDMFPGKILNMVGIGFICKKCQTANFHYFTKCCKCHEPFVIKSVSMTEYFIKQNEELKNK